MEISTSQIAVKDRIVSFVWQHVLLAVSLFIMTSGVALCVRSDLGSSVISTIPFVMTLAGSAGHVPDFTIGQYTYIMNFILVGMQILVLRRRFEPVQLFQLLIGFVFGYLLDINMWITDSIAPVALSGKAAVQLLGCTVLAVGISLEVRCGSVTMPGEGMPAAISAVSSLTFAKSKIMVDVCLVAGAVALMMVYFGVWLWQVVGVGTLFAMIYVGAAVRFLDPYMRWFDSLLCYRPGFRRYIYGLARLIRH